MARTTEEILAEINSAAEGYAELSDLQANTSKVSFWGYVKRVVAMAVLTLETIQDKHKETLEQLIDVTEIGSRTWYVAQALAYQYGDALMVVNNRPIYATTDEKKRIIQRVSVTETDSAGELLFKVLKADNAQMTEEEMAGFQAYMNQVKLLGTKVAVVSAEAVRTRFTITVELSAMVFNADGTRKSDGQRTVEREVEAYLAAVPFDSVFYVSKLEDKIQDIEGVEDVEITEAFYLEEGRWVAIHRKFTPHSGWMRTAFEGAEGTRMMYSV